MLEQLRWARAELERAIVGLGRVVAVCYLLIHFIPDSLTYSVPLFLNNDNRWKANGRRTVAARRLLWAFPRRVRLAPQHRVIITRPCVFSIKHH